MQALTPRTASLPVRRPLVRRPIVTVDIAIFSVIDDRPHVLLARRPDSADEPQPGAWALPGGCVDVDLDTSLEACALRQLHEKAGVVAPWLEQVVAHGGPDRDPRGWSVTHLYAALVPTDQVLEPDRNAAGARWHALRRDGRPKGVKLAFDHGRLLAEAIARIRSKSEYTDLPVRLLPKRFTLPELQHIFEIVLGRPIDKKAFRTRVLAGDMLEKLDDARATGKRPARLYRLRDRRHLHVFRRSLEGGPAA